MIFLMCSTPPCLPSVCYFQLPPLSPLPLWQFNSAARQLIELDKSSDSNGDSGEGASSGPQSNGAQRAGEKKNSKKRHSFTSLTMSHKPALAPPPQRHSMEISGPVLISSSNPTAAARIGEITGGLSCSAPSQVKGTFPSKKKKKIFVCMSSCKSAESSLAP